ncbi:hypothetical protein PPYR_10499 [Photinus pyralis]|uniref:Kinesin-like protein n=1 Tax=Photinus pyralis TaxID=7054 RepID=A0A1Y1LLC5_PHOPY|nr:hypothetical protein PPYR_10499 [Photinus pyralis]
MTSTQTNTDLLEVGTRVDIRRTDGRIHSAFVAGIDWDAKCTNVEWCENDETKGKEVELVAILNLNPHLRIEHKNTTESPEDLPKPRVQTSSHTTTHRDTSLPIPRKINRVQLRNSCVESLTDVQPVRTSRVVARVEKLKKNREDRRKKYVEEKIEKATAFGGADNPHQALIRMISEFRKGLVFKPLSTSDIVESHLITVCVRKRPLNKNEISRKEVDVITIPSINQLIVHEPKNKIDLTKYMDNQMFRFDYAFDETCDNATVYKYTAQPLVKSVFQGCFATCFAYGQTGAGKTHTMGGNFIGRNQDCHQGVYGMATKDVFHMARSTYANLKLTVSASFFEIYSGKVFDLLANKKKLTVLEDGKQQIQIVGLTEKAVLSPNEVLQLISKGNMARTFGQTAANTYSSRSHAIFQLILRSPGHKNIVHGKLSLIDLAGNERGADTASTDRHTRMEGAEINKSLLALKECIRALGFKQNHLPFRMSKLTQVLKDSFVGPNSRTCMIAMISPGVSSCEHSLNTLRYANRVKELVAGDVETNAASITSDDGTISEDIANFHHAVSELQVAEEKLMKNHQDVIKQLISTTEKGKSLLKMTNAVEYDQEQYCAAWDNLLTNAISTLNNTKQIGMEFKSKLLHEEKLSRKTRPVNSK